MKIIPLFETRLDAGRKLAKELELFRGKNVVILGIPNGGVPIGFELAMALDAEFDVVISRKIPIPLRPEAGFGSIADDGTIFLNEGLVKKLGLTEPQINYEANRVRTEVKRRTNLYRGDRPLTRITGRTVIITDDGLASGMTMVAAAESIRHRAPKDLIVAVPVASQTAMELVKPHADRIITCAVGGTPFAVAAFYHHWYDLKQNEVLGYMEKWSQHQFERRSV